MSRPFGPHRRLNVEPLEDRALLATGLSAGLSGGVLRVAGTEGADLVVLRQTPSGVTFDTGRELRLYVGVNRVEVDSRGGNDQVYVDTRAVEGTGYRKVDALLNGGAGNDTLVSGAGNDTLVGGAGADTLSSLGGNDRLDGGDGGDRVYGGDGNDTLLAGYGDDLASGGRGNDSVDAGSGNDWAYGGEGTDNVLGGNGDDYTEGGSGDDDVYGGSGADWVIGGAGNDRLFGEAGADRLDGGPGADAFNGGDGFDQYRNEFGDLIDQLDASAIFDVKQGGAGTCVLLASLGAVANSGVNLAGRIQQLGANQYSVPLYREGTGWVKQSVYFDGVWTDNDPMLASPGDAWVLIYQRAYLQEMGVRWNDPNTHSWASTYGDKYQRADMALTALTGNANWAGSVPVLSNEDLGELLQALSGRRATIALTKSSGMGQYGLIDGHAYTVLGTRVEGGVTMVYLRNPWGTDGPTRFGANDGEIAISWESFRRAMLGFSYA